MLKGIGSSNPCDGWGACCTMSSSKLGDSGFSVISLVQFVVLILSMGLLLFKLSTSYRKNYQQVTRPYDRLKASRIGEGQRMKKAKKSTKDGGGVTVLPSYYAYVTCYTFVVFF